MLRLNEDHYKHLKTRRDFVYTYYYEIPTAKKPFILFLHGFPSTSHDWAPQAGHFSDKGYGLIIPDLLGYGDTDKPTNPKEYRLAAMARDVMDILDYESINNVLLVGHDCGASLSSRIMNFFSERILGVAFLAVGYIPPAPDYNYERSLEVMNQRVGYDVFGYWEYFSSKDAAKKLEENIDSFYSLLFPQDQTLWRTDLAPRGKVRQWIENNRQAPLPSYLDEQARKIHQTPLLQGGFIGPLRWYEARVAGLNNADDAAIPQEKWSFSTPTFFGSALKDYICISEVMKAVTQRFASNLTVEEFDTGHWIMFEAPHKLNAALERFFTEIGS